MIGRHPAVCVCTFPAAPNTDEEARTMKVPDRDGATAPHTTGTTDATNASGTTGGPGAPGAPGAGAAELLSTRQAFDGRHLEVRVDRVRLPNGREHDFELIHHPGAVAVVPLLATGEVVMVHQYRYATGGWLLEIPAGTLGPGEEPLHCAGRELEEETGYRAEELQPLGWIWTTPGFTDERIWLYLATGLTPGSQALEADEVLTLTRLPLAEALTMAARGDIVDSKSVAGLVRAAHHLRR
jgi:ADP-ribose pyrophosphatase